MGAQSKSCPFLLLLHITALPLNLPRPPTAKGQSSDCTAWRSGPHTARLFAFIFHPFLLWIRPSWSHCPGQGHLRNARPAGVFTGSLSPGRPCLQRTRSSLTQIPPLPLAVLSQASFLLPPPPTKTFSEVIPVWDPSHPPGTRSRGKLHPLPPTTSDSCRPAVFHCLPCPDGPLQTCQPWTTLQTPQSHLDGSQLPCPPKLFPSAPVSPPNPSTWSLSQNLGFVPNSPRPCPVTYLPPLPIATSAALHCSPGHRPCLPVPLSTLQAERAPFQK